MGQALSLIELSIYGRHLVVEQVHGVVAVSLLFELSVTATSDTPATIDDLLGKAFVLRLNSPLGDALPIHGCVTDVERVLHLANEALVCRYHLSLGPHAFPLTLGQDTRLYQDKNVKQIVEDILGRASLVDLTVRWQLEASPSSQPYVVQTAESDWAFIERMVADAGIYYYFEFADDKTTLVFADTSSLADDCGSPLPIKESAALGSADDALYDVREEQAIATTAVTMTDYDFTHPALDLTANHGDKVREVYTYPGGYANSSDGKARVKLEVERATAPTLALTASNANTRVRPGLTVEVESDDGLGGKYFCTRVSLSARQAALGGGQHAAQARLSTSAAAEVPDGLHSEVELRPSALTYRPPSKPAPIMSGPQSAVVTGPSGEELYTNDAGQVRVQFYWDRVGERDENSATFLRVSQFAVGNSMVTPRIGWDQWVAFHTGDANRPLTMSHLYDAEHPTPYALPENKTRSAWQTNTTPGDGSSNEIRFEDAAGAEEIFLNASKDMAVAIGHCRNETVGNNHAHDIGANHGVTIGTTNTVSIGAEHEVTIGAAESLTVTGERTTTIGQNDTCTIGAARSLTTTMGKTLDADGGRTLTVGSSLTAVAGMGVERTVLGACNVTVGAAWVCAAGMGLDHTTLGVSAEVVGAAKVCIAAKDISTAVKGSFTEAVGGAIVSSASKDSARASEGALSIRVGGAMLMNATSVEIEAEDRLVLRVGGASVTMTKSTIEVNAPSLASPGATIAKKGSTLGHN